MIRKKKYDRSQERTEREIKKIKEEDRHEGMTIRNDIKSDDFYEKSDCRSQFEVNEREMQSKEMIVVK